MTNRRHSESDHACLSNGSPGPFTPPRQFDIVDGQYVPKACCGDGKAGPFTPPVEFGNSGATLHDPQTCVVCGLIGRIRDDAAPAEAVTPDANADGYGWPPADYLPWGEAEKIIDQMIAEDQAAIAIGDPFTHDPQPGPLGLVYLAGPMRGIESFNFPAFHSAAAALREQGWGVFNPAEMDEANGFDFTGATGQENLSEVGFNLREALGADLGFITGQADAVAVLPGWEKSKGARAEVATARALGLPVFDALEGASRPIVSVDPSTPSIATRWTESAEIDTEALFDAMEKRGEADRFFLPKHLDEFESRFTPTQTNHAPSADGEVRTVSSTGGQKGKKPEVYDQIPSKALAELARHFGAGAEKYDAHNFRRGYPWSLCFNALMRHAWMFWAGEDYDLHKDGCPADCTDHLPSSKHIIAVAWHAIVLATFMDEHPEFDDRYKPEEI